MPALLKTTQIQEPSSASVNLTLDTNGNGTFAGTAVMSSPYTMRNKIINGAMQIWQRGTSGFTTLNTLTYVADRFWMFSGVGMNGTGSQVSSIGLTGYQYAMRVQRNSGNTATTALIGGQTIETVNCIELAGQQITVSFWARAGANYSAASNSLTCAIGTGTGTDQGSLSFIQGTWTGIAYNVFGTATLTTSWQRFTFTGTVPAGTNEIVFYLQATPVGTAGANDYFDFTGVQLERGTVATPFEYRPYGIEMGMCQRYYWRITGASTGTFPGIGSGVATGATTSRIYIKHPVQMRAAATYSYGGNISVYDGTGNPVVSAISATYAGLDTSMLDLTNGSGLTLGRGVVANVQSTSADYIQASAEL